MTTPNRRLRSTVLLALSGSLLATASLAAGTTAPSTSPETHAGRASVYQSLQEGSLEQVTSPDHIQAVTHGNVAPMEIWRALEHGERVECLSCIPSVSKLLYDGNRKTREISAWWLRRRIFGVFGPGQVYPQTIETLRSDVSPERRAYAAEALGEFLTAAGIPEVARAAVSDASPLVRVSAVRALERLNNQGPAAELATAIADAAPEVRLAALSAVVRVHVFTRLDAVVARLGDDDARVRRLAAMALGTLRSADAVVGLVALTDPAREKDAGVRGAAVAALGSIGDPNGRDAVLAAATDPDPLVQSAARIALRRL